MRCSVTLLRVRGVRRPKDEIGADPGTAGELALEVRAAEHNHYQRAVRFAHLYRQQGVSGTNVDALAPLVEPILARVGAAHLMLVGIETAADPARGVNTEYAQGWLVRMP